MKTRLWYIVALAATFLGGWWLGRYVSRPEIVERVRIETVFYERPQPFAVTERPVTVNVPRMLFAPADTVDRTVVVGDSVQITVTERTLEYRDSTYYARVAGPVVGPLGPRLDYFETYNKTIERVQLVREPYAWELGPALGAWMTSDGSGVWVGAYAQRTFGRFSVSASAGYDSRQKSAFGQVEACMALWRK
ncbi:DUF6808 domain-containing protein [Alistipes sp. An66]|uniref:DUF6808 domain-containing protein n=1 Tax=Alistipes sp. An66 TaxID=1965650 RepID=UPI000B3843CB|nr:hypothetical protein [Alistipes sp. An66]OUN59612.1 hypothetical protein B5G16_04650 [Alistipes sp. An66]